MIATHPVFRLLKRVPFPAIVGDFFWVPDGLRSGSKELIGENGFDI
jgi:hypothetical protein